MKLGEFLVESGKITHRDVERALVAREEMGGKFGQILVKLGLVSEVDVSRALSEQLEIPLLETADYPEDPVTVPGLSLDFMLGNSVVPIAVDKESAVFSAVVPQDQFLSKALGLALDRPISLCLGLESEIMAALQKHTTSEDIEESEEESFDVYADDQEFIEHLKDLASEAPIIRQVNQIIHRALDLGASDIHIEPFDDGLHLRYRVDGVIQEVADGPQASHAPAIASRIKLLANLNIAEQRLPQDGRIMTRVKGHELDLRVSTIPTVHGESIVMRVLDRQSIRLSLTDMGFADETLGRFEELLSRPHGVLLLTGPTGSGKTTTLYAALSSMDSESLKIITVEDPVEYQLRGINQIQVKPQIDLDFAMALRSILRQDPDIIMIGEMRDGETAQIGVQSALTGHLVLSTLHTNTAVSAITRLEDMGVERYLITSSVNGVLAQRLLRKLCTACREPVKVSEEVWEGHGLQRFMASKDDDIYRSKGCDACKHTGYRGRTGIHELFVLDSAMHAAILSGADATTLHTTARQHGMFTLFEDGLRKVAQGVTSMEELLRVTLDQQDEISEAVETAELDLTT
ncbi:MAG: general secretion pathway protein E [Halioglobus sp.]|jgi:general secretion pathway protein E